MLITIASLDVLWFASSGGPNAVVFLRLSLPLTTLSQLCHPDVASAPPRQRCGVPARVWTWPAWPCPTSNWHVLTDAHTRASTHILCCSNVDILGRKQDSLFTTEPTGANICFELAYERETNFPGLFPCLVIPKSSRGKSGVRVPQGRPAHSFGRRQPLYLLPPTPPPNRTLHALTHIPEAATHHSA